MDNTLPPSTPLLEIKSTMMLSIFSTMSFSSHQGTEQLFLCWATAFSKCKISLVLLTCTTNSQNSTQKLRIIEFIMLRVCTRQECMTKLLKHVKVLTIQSILIKFFNFRLQSSMNLMKSNMQNLLLLNWLMILQKPLSLKDVYFSRKINLKKPE
jgi:hypothetical protein